jgi:hypothetical protein
MSTSTVATLQHSLPCTLLLQVLCGCISVLVVNIPSIGEVLKVLPCASLTALQIVPAAAAAAAAAAH